MSPLRVLAYSVRLIVTGKDDGSENDPKKIAGMDQQILTIGIEMRIRGPVVVVEEEDEETLPGERARLRLLETIRKDSLMTTDGVQITLLRRELPVSGTRGRIRLAPPKVLMEEVNGDDSNVDVVTLATKARVAGGVETVDQIVTMKQKAVPST